MELCDFTGDSDFDFFIPNTKVSERSLKSNDGSYTNILNPSNRYDYANDLKLLKRRSPPQRKSVCPPVPNYDEGYNWDTDDLRCFPSERCLGMETAVSEQFPPSYGKPKTPNPFSFLEEGRKTTHIATRANVNTVVINPNECCNHDEPSGNRKFIIQFDKTSTGASADISDKCYAAERDQCEEFWRFVTTTPELEKAIKDGKFVHKSTPKEVQIQVQPHRHKHRCHPSQGEFPKLKKIVEKSKYTPEMEALRQHNLAIHAEDARRRAKLRGRLKEIEDKSGHKKAFLRAAKLRATGKAGPKCGLLADCFYPEADEVLAEMEVFDDISRNPVKASCASRQKHNLVCDELFIPVGDDLGGGEGEDSEEE